ARDRHLAAMRGVESLHRQRDRLAARFDAEPLRRLGDAWRLVPQRLQQTQHTVRAGSYAEQHRGDDAFAQFLGEVVENTIAWRLDILEQLLHQRIIVIGKRLQHREARFLFAIEIIALQIDDLGWRLLFVDIGAFQGEIDKAGDQFAVPNRNLPQQERHARSGLQERNRLAHTLVGFVDLVQEQKVGNVALFELAQNQLKLRHFFLVG